MRYDGNSWQGVLSLLDIWVENGGDPERLRSSQHQAIIIFSRLLGSSYLNDRRPTCRSRLALDWGHSTTTTLISAYSLVIYRIYLSGILPIEVAWRPYLSLRLDRLGASTTITAVMVLLAS